MQNENENKHRRDNNTQAFHLLIEYNTYRKMCKQRQMSFALGRYIHIKRNNTMETFPAGVSIFEAAFSALVDVAGAVRLLFKKYSILIKRISLVSSFFRAEGYNG